MKPESLSVVIITLNAEKTLGRCLDSVEPVADEILVVDSFSTDETKNICRARGVRFMQRAFSGYVDQVCFAADQAQHPILLSIDADEWLSSELCISVAAVKARFECDGYLVNRRNRYCGRWMRHGTWYPDRKLRLWRSEHGAYGGQEPHYRVVMAPGAFVGQLQGDLNHDTFETAAAHFTKARGFARLAAGHLRQQGRMKNGFAALTHPPFRFLKSLVLRAGFLDGWRGWAIAFVSAAEVFLKYAHAALAGRPDRKAS